MMDEKTLTTLEFHKILHQLESFTSFRPSAELALALLPVSDLEEALYRQNLTHEAVVYLSKSNQAGIGGSHDIRPTVELARHAGVATPQELLDIKDTLISARNLLRAFERNRLEYPRLSELVLSMQIPSGIIEAISLAISDHGEILDSASPALAAIRKDLKTVRERLQSKLQRYISDPATAPTLQEPIITQRDGRYVLPIRADFKGRIKAIVHDQSSSGATLFVEPLAVVELNNQNRQLQLEERDEERRILAAISAQIGAQAEWIEQCLSVLARFDFILACGKYALAIQAVQPQLVAFRSFLPKNHPRTDAQDQKTTPSNHPGSVIRLIQARHPLLDSTRVVPIDVELDVQTYALVITGPNTGGKTVALKTIGLLVLMAQAGLHIPAAPDSMVSVFNHVFADIGDEQSIEQSLSTFSGHIKNIIHILENADSRSLVILDELGAGTDPQEGAALARAILTYLLQKQITTIVTTHHPELKIFAHITPGAMNASVEFDIDTLQPTYHLTIGLPGRSNAIAIAQRLGMPEQIIELARSEIDPQDLQSQDMLDEIHRQRELARQAYQQADRARRDAEVLRQELTSRLEKIEAERQSILANAQEEAQQLLEEIQSEIRKARRVIVRTPGEKESPPQLLAEILQTEEQIENLEVAVEKKFRSQRKKTPPVRQVSPRPLTVGAKVRLRSLGTQGTITRIDGEEIEIQAGAVRIRSDINDILPVTEEAHPPAPASIEQIPSTKLLPGVQEAPHWELDVRGKRADEVEQLLEGYIDSAMYAGLPFIRIIHGKGSGRLRQVIREHLKTNPHILSFEAGEDREGGEGVTIVKLN